MNTQMWRDGWVCACKYTDTHIHNCVDNISIVKNIEARREGSPATAAERPSDQDRIRVFWWAGSGTRAHLQGPPALHAAVVSTPRCSLPSIDFVAWVTGAAGLKSAFSFCVSRAVTGFTPSHHRLFVYVLMSHHTAFYPCSLSVSVMGECRFTQVIIVFINRPSTLFFSIFIVFVALCPLCCYRNETYCKVAAQWICTAGVIMTEKVGLCWSVCTRVPERTQEQKSMKKNAKSVGTEVVSEWLNSWRMLRHLCPASLLNSKVSINNVRSQGTVPP